MKTPSYIVVSAAFAVLSLTVAYGAPTLKAPEFTVQVEQGKLVATSPASYHFNIQAPMSLKIVGKVAGSQAAGAKPVSATEQKVTFTMPDSSGAAYHLSIYMCDDAKTFCEKHEVDYSPTSKSSTSSVSTTSQTEAAADAAPKKMEHGFIVNDPDRAFALAKKQGKPLMIDFFGIWCPPCNELDEKVFPSSKFSHSAARFVRLKLDADKPISWNLKSRYQISGYPTIILATADGDEITRIVGYRDLSEFLDTLDSAWTSRDVSLVKLDAKAAQGDRAAADQAGLIHLDRSEAKAAAALLQGTTTKKEFLALAEIQVLEDDKAPNEKRIARLNQAIRDFPKTPNTIDWYEQLSQIYEDQKADPLRRESLTHSIDVAFELSKKPELLRGYDATPADLMESIAEHRDALDGREKAKQDWLNAARAFTARGVGDKERGNNLELAACLARGGELEKSRQIYQKLQAAYPDEFTFYYANARVELEIAKQPASAIELGNKALIHSYGDNRLRVALLLAQAYDAHGDRDKSKATIDETLKTAQTSSDPKVRVNRYLTALKDMRSKLN